MSVIRGSKTMSSNIYHSLESVLGTLTEVREYPEVQKLLNTCTKEGLLVKADGKYLPTKVNNIHKNESAPFVVIEGLDGSGKTTLSAIIEERYNMSRMQTPPAKVVEFRPFFDDQPEKIRRAFYSLGNYLAAYNVLHCTRTVIMDRFWHSTAAYALGRSKTEENTSNVGAIDWPRDLLQPNIVLFLFVSETERLRRHSTRHMQTNTSEEQSLAKDRAFRENIVEIYRRINGPRFIEINADDSMHEVQSRVFQILEETFPSLSSDKS